MTERRYPFLDVLRVLAVSMTILVHTPSITGHVPILRTIQWGLNLGVDLFMLISGWLLGGQLIRDLKLSRYSAPRFYFKRWMRTLPPYYAVLVLLVFLGSFPARDLFGSHILAHLVFLQEYLGVERYGVSWSLCVEEHFYLLLPILVPFIVRRFNPWRMAGALLAISVIQLLGRTFVYTPQSTLPYISHLRSEGLFIGLGLAYIAECWPDIWARLGRWVWPALAAGIPLTFLSMMIGQTAPSRLFFIGLPTLGTWSLALVFVAAVHERCALSKLRLTGFKYLGELTYSIYLLHNLIPVIFGDHAFGNPYVRKATELLAMVGLSMVLHHVVERPFMRVRAHVLRSKVFSGPNQSRPEISPNPDGI